MWLELVWKPEENKFNCGHKDLCYYACTFPPFKSASDFCLGTILNESSLHKKEGVLGSNKLKLKEFFQEGSFKELKLKEFFH